MSRISKAEQQFRAKYPNARLGSSARLSPVTVYVGDYLCAEGRTPALAYREALKYDRAGIITPDPSEVSTEQRFMCQNCCQLWTGADLEAIDDLLERVAPGETMPWGQCPECGAVCYPPEVREPAREIRQGYMIPAGLGHDDEPAMVAVIVTATDVIDAFEENGYRITKERAGELLEKCGRRLSDAFIGDWMSVLWDVLDCEADLDTKIPEEPRTQHDALCASRVGGECTCGFREEIDIAITGKGFYSIVPLTDAGADWLEENVSRDESRIHSDDTRLTQNVAEGATRDGLTVSVNGFLYLEGGKRGAPAA